MKIEQYGGLWGGETAGALYTNYLKPEIATVYIPKGKIAKLIRDMRLSKQPNFNHYVGSRVDIYTPFWPQDKYETPDEEMVNEIKQTDDNNKIHRINARRGLVNPVLVYADLIATGDVRNFEAAQILFNE